MEAVDGPAEPVAWRAIEPGWSVRDAAGGEVGTVDRIVGDLEADVFDGLAVGDGGRVLARARYVPAERVAAIHRGEVVLDLSPADAAALEPYAEPVSEPLAALEPPDERGDPDAPLPPGTLLRWLFGRWP